jgi:hypothetical protein
MSAAIRSAADDRGEFLGDGSSLVQVVCLAGAPVADLEVQVTTAQFECGHLVGQAAGMGLE